MTPTQRRRAILEELWNIHGRRLWTYLVSRLRDPHTAEDVLQEIFVKALASEARLPTVSAAKAYLFRSAHNAVVDLWKERRANSVIPADPPAQTRAPSSDRGEDFELLERALEALSPRDREILSLKYDADLTYREIAAAIDLPLGTVLARARRAMRRLARLMRSKESLPDGAL